MEAFEFFIPQNIMVGAGTMAKLPECAKKLGGSHAMLIPALHCEKWELWTKRLII